MDYKGRGIDNCFLNIEYEVIESQLLSFFLV